MPMNNAMQLDDFSWADAAMRSRLMADPLSVLREQGMNLPEELPNHVLQEIARLTNLIWQDGKVISKDRFRIDPFDDGLLFGHGVWESTRAIAGVPWLWKQHLDRLLKTAALLDMEVDPLRLPSTEQVADFIRTLTTMDVVVRLNVSAGVPGKPGTVWMTATLPPAPLASFKLQTLVSPAEKGEPHSIWKTFQYANRLKIGRQAQKAGFDSTLRIDADGNLLEAAHANIFVRMRDGWATPKAEGTFLPGTVRQYLLDKSPMPIREQVIPKALLGEVTEAFVTNSNVGIVPVSQIDSQTLKTGGDTQTLMRLLQASVR